jgi:hypothetical protein
MVALVAVQAGEPCQKHDIEQQLDDTCAKRHLETVLKRNVPVHGPNRSFLPYDADYARHGQAGRLSICQHTSTMLWLPFSASGQLAHILSRKNGTKVR